MIVGKLELKTTSGDEVFEGFINTLDYSVSFEIHLAPESANPNAPTHVVFGWSKNKTLIRIGAGWEKTIKRGPNEGSTFISLTIDDPSLKQAMNVAAFRTDKPGIWDVVYKRRQETAA